MFCPNSLRTASAAAGAVFARFRPKRWTVLLLASALLHVTAYQWAYGSLAAISVRPDPMPQELPPVLITLAPPASNETAAVSSSPKKPPAAKPARSEPDAAKESPIPEEAPSDPLYAVSQVEETQESQNAQAVTTSVESAQTLGAADPHHENAFGTGSGDIPSAEPLMQATDASAGFNRQLSGEKPNGKQDEMPATVRYQASPPPSARLSYDVRAERKGMLYHGTGMIDWASNGTQYAITGRAKALFFTVLEFRSEGVVADSGIVPVRYMEKAGAKPQAAALFDPERRTISFASSTTPYPAGNTAQDRASIIWQLAAIGRGSPDLIKPGVELEIVVAGVRNAEPRRIRVIGEETVELERGPVRTWHLKSIEQKKSKEKTLDVWLASEQEWYPVKLRHTEVDGDYLELSLTNLSAANR